MKLCDETVTLFNARFDKAEDCTVYERTVLNGVHSYATMRSSVDSNGLKSANTVTIRIPAGVDSGGKRYVSPDGYTQADDVSELFTLNEGDIIIPGNVQPDEATLSVLHKFHGSMTILGVTDNRRAPNAPHWKVVGA